MATTLTSYATYKSEDVKAALESAREQYRTECTEKESTSDPECDDLDKILTDDRLSHYLTPGTRAGTLALVNETGFFPLAIIHSGINETIIRPDGYKYTRTISRENTVPRVTTRSSASCMSSTVPECGKENVLFANILSASMYVEFNPSTFIDRDDVYKYNSAVRHAAYWLQSHNSEKQTRFYLHDN